MTLYNPTYFFGAVTRKRQCKTVYRRIWLFSACIYEISPLQETMRLTDSVRLTKSGIALVMPSKLKHVCDVTAEPVIRASRRQCRVRGAYFLHESVV